MTTAPESEQAKLAVDGQSQLLGDGNLTSLARYEYYKMFTLNALFVV